MGLCASGKVGDSYKDESEIDRQLREEKERAERTYKVLLLGAGESGKSTVIKQVKILYKTGISAEEAAQYTKSIRNNAVECMAVLLEACGRFELPVDGEHAARKEVVDQARKDNKQLDEAVPTHPHTTTRTMQHTCDDPYNLSKTVQYTWGMV